jgi:2,3-bisphosphoglycerate-dependent phosphoglycerate mutase
MQLVLIRHGESVWNKENLFTGWTDVDLSEKGRTEAKDAGNSLLEEGFVFDKCYTSYLKRAIHTANIVMEGMDLEWIDVEKSWKLNERHYGALQGLNKSETAQKYGEEQVTLWRRSYDVRPPALNPADDRCPSKDPRYSSLTPAELPLTESLEDTVARVVPYYESKILKDMQAGLRLVVVAHGNSLRALVKHLEGVSDDEIVKLNIPTGVPLVYDFDDDMNITGKRYVGNQDEIAAKADAVANQGKKA